MSAYLDASVILPTLIDELRSTAVDRFISETEEPLIISEFTGAEVASALPRAPDALHAAACRRDDLLLVTLDKRLAVAAVELGIGTELLK